MAPGSFRLAKGPGPRGLSQGIAPDLLASEQLDHAFFAVFPDNLSNVVDGLAVLGELYANVVPPVPP